MNKSQSSYIQARNGSDYEHRYVCLTSFIPLKYKPVPILYLPTYCNSTTRHESSNINIACYLIGIMVQATTGKNHISKMPMLRQNSGFRTISQINVSRRVRLPPGVRLAFLQQGRTCRQSLMLSIKFSMGHLLRIRRVNRHESVE